MSATQPVGSSADLTPYPAQLPFLERDRRYYAFISGIGAGKTAAGCLRTFKNIRDWNPGESGFIVAPTVPSLRNTIIPELRKWGLIEPAEFNRSEKRLEYPNGSTIYLDSADNDRKIERLRGPSISWFWIDEAATVNKRAWDILVGRLRTGEYRNGFITTTPKGENWVYGRFVDDGPDDVRALTGIESTTNPHLPDDYASITDEYEGRFYKQEVEGQFVGYEGLVYPWFDDSNLTDDPPEEYDEVVYGVDWGHNNPAVVLAIVRRGDQWTVVDEWYERRCTVQDHSRAAEDMVKQWGEGPIYCDPSEPANIEQLRRDGLAAKKAENDVTPGIQHVASLADRLKVARHCQNVRNEFSQYQYKDGGDGDRPLKQHDHAMDALRYGLYTHDRRSPSGTGGAVDMSGVL